MLIRPAVEAGEKLGFLPGDLNQKVDPYLRPLYDALFEMLGIDKANRLIKESGALKRKTMKHIKQLKSKQSHSQKKSQKKKSQKKRKKSKKVKTKRRRSKRR